MKVVNNMMAASNIVAACEAMAMAAKLGIDLERAMAVVNASSGASWMFADRMARALVGDYEPRAAARILNKDIGIAVALAKRLGVDATAARTAQAAFAAVLAAGYGDSDDAALIRKALDSVPRGRRRGPADGAPEA
jgi:3-hydroxyisobutyrate dehydrogenase